jgi:outer membrane protein TolC
MQVNKALIAFQSNKARIERYESVLLPLSVTVMDKSRLAFYEGKTNVLMAINAQQAYMNTRLGYLQSLMDYQNAVGDLERTVGTAL